MTSNKKKTILKETLLGERYKRKSNKKGKILNEELWKKIPTLARWYLSVDA